jgi:tricarballylate dehydrogenase
MGVNVGGLVDTVSNFNAAVDSNDESLFEPFKLDGLSTGDELAMPKSNWAIPLNKPPYVAYGVTYSTSSSSMSKIQC